MTTLAVPVPAARVSYLCLFPLSTAVLIDQPDSESGVASGVNNTLRQLGITAGIAARAAISASTGQPVAGAGLPIALSGAS